MHPSWPHVVYFFLDFKEQTCGKDSQRVQLDCLPWVDFKMPFWQYGTVSVALCSISTGHVDAEPGVPSRAERGSPFNLVGTWVSATPPHQPSTLLPAGQEGGGGKKKHSAFLYTNMVPNHFWSAFAICLIGVGRLSYSWVNMHMFCPYQPT